MIPVKGNHLGKKVAKADFMQELLLEWKKDRMKLCSIPDTTSISGHL